MNGKIRIQRRADALDAHSKWYQVFLDDMDISKFVHSVSLDFQAGDIPRVKLEIIGIVELPDDIEAAINIYRSGDEDDKNTS